MGCHFPAMSGTDPFVIDQTVSVDVSGRSKPWLRALLPTLGEALGQQRRTNSRVFPRCSKAHAWRRHSGLAMDGIRYSQIHQGNNGRQGAQRDRGAGHCPLGYASVPAMPGGTTLPCSMSCESLALAAWAPWSSTPEPAAREMTSPPRPRSTYAKPT